MKKTLILLAALLGLTACSKQNIYNVKDFGALGDGQNLDSPAINAAIEEASAHGGGTILLPEGTYMSYSIRLKDNITLQLEKNAVLMSAMPTDDLGYDLPEDYDYKYFQDFGHSHFHNSLIWGEGLHDIAIIGEGRIDGHNLFSHQERPGLKAQGNKAIALKECQNVRLEGFEMLQCGHFALLATGIDHMNIENLTIDTNRDALDIDCCTDVKITHCSVNSPHDDAIVLKSSYALNRFKDCENIEVAYCQVSGYDCGTLLDGSYQLSGPPAPDRGGRTGRIKLGTESSGGYRHINIHDCTFTHCRGLALETVDGGILEDVHCWNLEMNHIVNAPIFLRLGARLRSPEGTPVGQLKDVVIEHVVAHDVDSRYSSIIAGIPEHYIENVKFSDIEIHHRGGCRLTDETPVIAVAPWEKPQYKEPQQRDKLSEEEKEQMRKEFEAWRKTERDTALVCNLNYPVAEVEAGYPEPWMFGIVPAKGMFIRHAKNIQFENVRFFFDEPDPRPLFHEEDVENITKTNVTEG